MHEFALVKGLLEAVLEGARAHGIKRVEKIKVVVGELTAVNSEALEFSFQVLSRETPAGGAVLQVEKKKIQLKCEKCHRVYFPQGLKFNCPGCGGRNTEIIKGRELFVDYFEGK